MSRNTPDVWFLPLYTAHPDMDIKRLNIRIASSKNEKIHQSYDRSTPYWWVTQRIKPWLAPHQVSMPEKQLLDHHLSYVDHDKCICTYTTFDSGETRSLRLLLMSFALRLPSFALPAVQVPRLGKGAYLVAPSLHLSFLSSNLSLFPSCIIYSHKVSI